MYLSKKKKNIFTPMSYGHTIFFLCCSIFGFKSYEYVYFRFFTILQLPNTFEKVVQIQRSCLKYLIVLRYVILLLFLPVTYIDVSFMLVDGHISICLNTVTNISHIMQHLAN
jgi:hypothetical protein